MLEEEEEEGAGNRRGAGGLRRRFQLRKHQLDSPRRGREGGVSNTVEGSCDRGGENNAKRKERRAVKGGGEWGGEPSLRKRSQIGVGAYSGRGEKAYRFENANQRGMGGR